MEPKELPRRVVGKIMWISHRQWQKMSQRMEEIHIAGGSAPILMQLGFHGEMSQTKLARHMGISSATVSQSLKPLVRDRLVERGSDEADARVFRLRLTEAGLAKRAEVERILAEIDEELLTPLDASEQRDLVRLLEKIETNLKGEQA